MAFLWKRYFNAEAVVNTIEQLINSDYDNLRKWTNAIEIRTFHYKKITGFVFSICPVDQYGASILEKDRYIYLCEYGNEIAISISKKPISKIPDLDLRLCMTYDTADHKRAAEYIIGKICDILEV